MTTYNVTVTHEDNLWVADVANTPSHVVGVMDYEHLADLHADVASFIADLLNVSETEVAVEYHYEVGGRDVTAALRHLLTAEQELRGAQQERERARKETLAELTDAGVSQATIGDVLGLSHQRVHQLVKAGE